MKTNKKKSPKAQNDASLASFGHFLVDVAVQSCITWNHMTEVVWNFL
jgi:hypothetical protein